LIVRAPYTASLYPKDKERPEWVKQPSVFIAQALTSIKISAPSGSTEPDFFTVDESLNTPIEVLVPLVMLAINHFGWRWRYIHRTNH
jgi:hypothetical protein